MKLFMVDKLGEGPEYLSDEAMSRRAAIQWIIGSIALLPTAGMGIYMVLRYLMPKVVLEERRFRLAKVSEIPDAGLEARVKGTAFIVVHEGDKLRAFSTVCTHLGCHVNWQPDKLQFHCPCHQGYFDKDGKVIAGPPPQSLPEYPLEIDGEDIYIRLVVT
jgi:Rieske Fe-S protein